MNFHTLNVYNSIQFNSIFYFSELYLSEKHIHVIKYLNNRLDIITKTSLDYPAQLGMYKEFWPSEDILYVKSMLFI